MAANESTMDNGRDPATALPTRREAQRLARRLIRLLMIAHAPDITQVIHTTFTPDDVAVMESFIGMVKKAATA